MTIPSKEQIEAAARALLFRETMSDDGLSLDQMAQIALSAAYPLMEAQAKGEALREAADTIEARPDMKVNTTYAAITQESVNWLRARAATIEGKDS